MHGRIWILALAIGVIVRLIAFINEESNVRQLVCAIRADQRHFGDRPVIYLMSEYAMHSQIPQLLASRADGSGLRREELVRDCEGKPQ